MKILLLLSIAVLRIYSISEVQGKIIHDDVLGLLGFAYAQRPVGLHRFEESVPVRLDFSQSLSEWPHRCISRSPNNGTSEDCLYFSLLRKRTTNAKKKTLLIVTNEWFHENTIASLVSDQLNVVVASIRDGVLGSFGSGRYGVSDVITLISVLKENSDELLIGDITIWAEDYLAETVSTALPHIGLEGAILINGNAATRLYDTDHYASRATYKLRTQTMCDLPSISQSIDCLRSKPIEQILKETDKVMESFYPFGSPFRAPRDHIPDKNIPMILGVRNNLHKDYPQENDFGDFDYKQFRRFLAGLIPDSLHSNAPLLRRVLLHHYIYSRGNKKDSYHLYTQMLKILIDRDFRVTTRRLVDHLVSRKNMVWLLEYDTNINCLQQNIDSMGAFCDRQFKYFVRFAIKGQPTSGSCDLNNPTFPRLGSSKRDFYVVLGEDGVPQWEFNFHLPEVELWNNLLPALDSLELTGRRDSLFPEEEEIDPLNIEDDVQMWHERASEDTSELTEEKALHDMPNHLEL